LRDGPHPRPYFHDYDGAYSGTAGSRYYLIQIDTRARARPMEPKSGEGKKPRLRKKPYRVVKRRLTIPRLSAKEWYLVLICSDDIEPFGGIYESLLKTWHRLKIPHEQPTVTNEGHLGDDVLDKDFYSVWGNHLPSQKNIADLLEKMVHEGWLRLGEEIPGTAIGRMLSHEEAVQKRSKDFLHEPYRYWFSPLPSLIEVIDAFWTLGIEPRPTILAQKAGESLEFEDVIYG